MTNPLAQITKAEAALASASDIVDILDLRTKAKAVEVVALAEGCGEVAQQAKIIQLKAERKAGGWLHDNITRGRPLMYQDGNINLDDLQINRHQSSRWQLIATIPDERFDDWIDDKLSSGQEVTAGGARNLARNIQGRPIVGRTTSGIYILNPVGCALIGYGCQCYGDCQNGHLINESKARGNAEVKKYLKQDINISPQCAGHNVGRMADTHEARKIQLLQKIFRYGWSEVKEFYDNVPWKVPKPEFELERMLE